jgi:hypothetical protein
MTTSDNKGGVLADVNGKDRNPRPGRKKRSPEWARGLKQIYDSVVEEPIPDNFAALLARLDDEGK